MSDVQILYTCDHEVLTRSIQTKSGTIIRGSNPNLNNMDRVEFAPNIQNVLDIYQVINNETVKLSPEIYNFYDGYVIWLRPYSPTAVGAYRVPNIGETYTVNLSYMEADKEVFTKADCPKCSGTGWYLSLICEGKDLSQATGPMKVAQEFLKCLLTAKGTDFLSNEFGAGLLSTSGVPYLDKNLTQHIESAVKNAEIQCKSITESRPKDELLASAVITSLVTDTDSGGVIVNITLTTQDSTEIKFGLTA